VSAGVGVNINGVRLCMEDARIIEVGDAQADTDAVNRRTADGRYIGLPATPERGDLLFFNGSTWARLAHGTAGQVLTSGGHGADPYWA
jgi:hypothetical protein